MKISGTLKMTGAIILSLIIGFLIGISVEYPKVDKQELSGAIAKVKNFRNVKATADDIKLKDELVSDTVRLKSLKTYMNYQYLKAASLSSQIKQTVAEAGQVKAFQTTNQELINQLNNYGTFLTKARQDLMLVYVSLSNPKKVDPALLREMLEEAGNTVAQMKFRNQTILDVINSLEAFLNKNPKADFPGLEQAHDVLMLSVLNNSVMTGDKLLQKWLSDKQLLTDVEKLGMFDAEALKIIYIHDSEKLGTIDIEDSEKLGALMDHESLKGVCDQLMFNSQEKLGFVYTDQEKLGRVFQDQEKLGLMDHEKLGANFPDAEKLGITDSELLGLVN
jgi:hypothetical protein